MGAVNYEVYVILIVFNLIQFILKKILNLILINNFLYFFPVFLNSLKKNNWYN